MMGTAAKKTILDLELSQGEDAQRTPKMEPQAIAVPQPRAAGDAATVEKHRCAAGPPSGRQGGTPQATDDRAPSRGAALPAAGPPTTGSHTHAIAAVDAHAADTVRRLLRSRHRSAATSDD